MYKFYIKSGDNSDRKIVKWQIKLMKINETWNWRELSPLKVKSLWKHWRKHWHCGSGRLGTQESEDLSLFPPDIKIYFRHKSDKAVKSAGHLVVRVLNTELDLWTFPTRGTSLLPSEMSIDDRQTLKFGHKHQGPPKYIHKQLVHNRTTCYGVKLRQP